MQNPKIQAAFQEMMGSGGGPMGMMSNPGKIQEMMADPEIGPFLQKLSEFRYPHKVYIALLIVPSPNTYCDFSFCVYSG